MLFSFFDAIDWGTARVVDTLSFLRSIPSLLAPKPSASGLPYTAPFSGGQCTVAYWVQVRLRSNEGSSFYVWTSGTQSENPEQLSPNSTTPVYGGVASITSTLQSNGANVTVNGKTSSVSFFISNYGQGNNGSPEIYRVRRVDGGLDNCGDIPNPNPNPSIKDDGLFTPNNPVIGDENGTTNPAAIILSPAAPLIAIGGGLALAAAAAAAAKAASDALEAIKKVAEALDALKDLWKKLQEFLEEWDKDRPKNRDIVRQTYGTIEGDGAIDFYPLNNKVFDGVQIDIVVTEVPIGFGKYFGNSSPSRYRYKELGYISFYSINQGIISTHSIEFKRTSLAIPKIAVGFIYHFGLDNRVKGFAFGTFSVRKN